MSGITLHNVRVSGGGKISFNGYDQLHRVSATLDAVQLTDQASYTYSLNHADLTLGPGSVNLQLPVGEDSTIQKSPPQETPHSGIPASCAPKFVDFPNLLVKPS
jgi:polygalacturonase